MLSEKQILEIREHLDTSQNPLFFFDNDNDGLASFLLFRRFIERGRGIPIKSFPDLNVTYFRKVVELKSDYIFILDKPVVSKEFIAKAKEHNIPIVWIDHHKVEKPEEDYINYYNPFYNDETTEPVSYLSYKITNNKKDMWIAMIGCISDCYMPDFYPDFEKNFPELTVKNPKSPFQLLYDSEIGKIARILDFSLKDTTTNVVNMLKFMFNVESPIDILQEDTKTKQLLKRYDLINEKYQKLMEKARKQINENLLYFKYSGDLSLSSNISNQLIYEFPDKVIVVIYVRAETVNISMRGKRDMLKLTRDCIEGIPGATGGGHENATGIRIDLGNLPLFKKRLEGFVNKS